MDFKSFFWFGFCLLILLHLCIIIKTQNGHKFYLQQGYALILVSVICLGLVVQGLAFTDDPCSNAIGYCSTISCIAGNMYYQGYVFMSVIFCINAYICLRTISVSGEITQIEQEMTHLPENEDYKELLNVEENIKPHKDFGYIYDAENKVICPCWGKSPRVLLSPYLDGNITLHNLLRLGIIVTTFTGILPAIAYDDPIASPLAVLSNSLHVLGLSTGIAIIMVTLAVRVVCRFSTDCCSPNTTKKKSSEVIFTRVEYTLDFILFLINVALLVYFLLHFRAARTPQSWFCMGYENNIECNAADRNLSTLLMPWPCVWNQTNREECTNPHCPWEYNAEGVIVEYFVLVYVIVLLASYLSSFAGPLSEIASPKGKCLCT